MHPLPVRAWAPVCKVKANAADPEDHVCDVHCREPGIAMELLDDYLDPKTFVEKYCPVVNVEAVDTVVGIFYVSASGVLTIHEPEQINT